MKLRFDAIMEKCSAEGGMGLGVLRREGPALNLKFCIMLEWRCLVGS